MEVLMQWIDGLTDDGWLTGWMDGYIEGSLDG